MDKYIRVARVYPAVLGMLPTCILLAMCMGKWFPQYEALVGNVQWVLCLIGGTALVSMAVGYLVREVFNNSSLKFEITAKRLYAASQRVL